MAVAARHLGRSLLVGELGDAAAVDDAPVLQLLAHRLDVVLHELEASTQRVGRLAQRLWIGRRARVRRNCAAELRTADLRAAELRAAFDFARLDRRSNLLHFGRVDLLATHVLPRLLTQDDPAALVVVAARLAVAVAAAAARLQRRRIGPQRSAPELRQNCAQVARIARRPHLRLHLILRVENVAHELAVAFAGGVVRDRTRLGHRRRVERGALVVDL